MTHCTPPPPSFPNVGSIFTYFTMSLCLKWQSCCLIYPNRRIHLFSHIILTAILACLEWGISTPYFTVSNLILLTFQLAVGSTICCQIKLIKIISMPLISMFGMICSTYNLLKTQIFYYSSKKGSKLYRSGDDGHVVR